MAGGHSFIHYGDLYSAPSRLLLRSAPDPCTAKEKSFKARVKCPPLPSHQQCLVSVLISAQLASGTGLGYPSPRKMQLTLLNSLLTRSWTDDRNLGCVAKT